MPYTSLLVLLSLLISIYAAASTANEGRATSDLTDQRALFLRAEQALEAGDRVTFKKLKSRLDDYPLLPYLQYQEIVHTLKEQNPHNIRKALTTLTGTPLQHQLLNRWLALLADKGLWYSYLSFSQPGGNVKRQCHRLQAQIKTGKRQQAFTSVPKIWLSGTSRPTACDPVFNAWIDAGELTQDLVWQRVALAMKKGETRLANYLKRFLNRQESRWVEQWLKLYNDPGRITRLSTEVAHPMLDEMATQAIQRLAWRDVDAAYAAWTRLSQDIAFSDWQHLQVVRSLMGQLSRQESQLQSQQVTALLPKRYLHLDSNLAEKQLQHALQNRDWQLVLLTVEGLPKQDQQDERWRYWKARALIRLDRAEAGEAILKALSVDRSYYGFLAAQQLGDRPKLLHERLDADAHLMQRLLENPALQRARELHHLGRSLAARREWNIAMLQRSDAELQAAARIAQQWDWPSQVILTLTRLRQWNDLELRFPLTHQNEITAQAQDAGIDKAWIYAIMRQESAFMQDAKSPVGARGLMQLMPKTAESMAKELRLAITDPDELYKPELNIKLGTGYLNKIFRRLQENPVLATAAYNAGPWRVVNWLPKQTQPADIWIETVPFRETREYLKRVLAYTVIYNYRLGEDPSRPQSIWLQPIEAPGTDTSAKLISGTLRLTAK
jgi:soluble lytic murein transglycosylase